MLLLLTREGTITSAVFWLDSVCAAIPLAIRSFFIFFPAGIWTAIKPSTPDLQFPSCINCVVWWLHPSSAIIDPSLTIYSSTPIKANLAIRSWCGRALSDRQQLIIPHWLRAARLDQKTHSRQMNTHTVACLVNGLAWIELLTQMIHFRSFDRKWQAVWKMFCISAWKWSGSPHQKQRQPRIISLTFNMFILNVKFTLNELKQKAKGATTDSKQHTVRVAVV